MNILYSPADVMRMESVFTLFQCSDYWRFYAHTQTETTIFSFGFFVAFFRQPLGEKNSNETHSLPRENTHCEVSIIAHCNEIKFEKCFISTEKVLNPINYVYEVCIVANECQMRHGRDRENGKERIHFANLEIILFCVDANARMGILSAMRFYLIGHIFS